MITRGRIKFAIRACLGKIEPVKGLRRLNKPIGKFAIRAWREKMDPVNGLRVLSNPMGKFAMRGAPGINALLPVLLLINRGNGTVAIR